MTQTEESANAIIKHKSPKSAKTAYLLCLFLGLLGAHRLYVGKISTGLLMLITFGGLGFWAVIDLILIVNNKFDDKQNRTLILSSSHSTIKKFLYTIGSLLCWLALVCACLFTLVMWLTQGLADTAKLQLDAIKEGQFEKAYSYTSSYFKEKISLQQFKQFLINYPELKQYKKATFMSRYIENNQYGQLTGYLTLENGQTMPVEFKLIKQNEQWKINYFQFKH